MSNVTYLGRDILIDEEGKFRVVPDWKLFQAWSILEPFEYNDFGYNARSNIKTLVTEHAAEETPFKFDPGADGQWVDIQAYLTLRNEGKTERNIAFDYSYELAMKKSKALVPHVIDDEGNVSLDINGLALRPDEAVGRSGTKNHARRIRVSAGFVNIKSVKVDKDDTPLDIIKKLEAEEYGTMEECFVKVTNIGTNPYTHEQVRTPSRPIDYNTIRVDGQVKEDALKPLRDFYSQFDMNKHNFQGYVNKKSDGRSLTGYPDPKTGEFLQQNRHNVSIIIQPNVQIQETSHTVKFAQRGALQQEKEISKVTRGNECECGCNVKVKDMRRGEVVCPSCGLVFHRDTIVG